KTILPENLAESMAPYLRYMPQLTRAQQASAANLGNFPRASEIGRDDPRFAQYAAAAARSPTVAAADAGLVPKGEPLGRGSRSRSERQASRAADQERSRQEDRDRKPPRTAARSSARSSASEAARVAPPEPQPAREAVVEPGQAIAA